VREKPGLGLVPSVGGAAADLMGPLHFGNFAGLLSKAVWFALGFASCYVALTGMLLWTARRAESPTWRRMERAVTWVGFGLPLSLAVVPWGYFIGRSIGAMELEAPMAIAFIATALATGLLTIVVSEPERLRRFLLAGTGMALIGAPALRLITDGPGWISALSTHLATVPALDIALLLGGVLCLRAAWRRTRVVVPAAQDGDNEEGEVAAS